MECKHVNLSGVDQISRGDKSKRLRYLNQFVSLMDDRSAAIVDSMNDSDFLSVQRLVHSMAPQLIFFEVTGSREAVHHIESAIGENFDEETKAQVTGLISHVKGAVNEITQIISEEA